MVSGLLSELGVGQLLKTSPASLTFSLKIKTVGSLTLGAVNVVLKSVWSDSFTGGPAVCVHVYVSSSLSSSLLAEPSSCTGFPAVTVCLGPALATLIWKRNNPFLLVITPPSGTLWNTCIFLYLSVS